MAYQAVGNLLIPVQELEISRVLAMDADAHYVAQCFPIFQAGNIKKIHFRTGAVTTSDTLKVAIQDIGADGEPDGADDISTTIGSLTANTWHTATFSGSLAVTVGQRKAVVFSFNSYVAGNLELRINNSPPRHYLTVYCLNDLGVGTWSFGWSPLLGVELDDSTFLAIPGVPPGLDASESYDANDSPDERGNLFNLPFPVAVTGARFRIRNYNNDGDFDLHLHHSGGTVTRSITDQLGAGSEDWAILPLTETEIAANSDFRLTVEAKHATQVIYIVSRTFLSAAARGQEELGSVSQYTSRTDGGSWSQDTTKQAHVYPVFSKLDDGAATIIQRLRRVM